MEQNKHLIEGTIRLFLTIVTVIVVVFMSQILLNMQEEMVELKAEIAALNHAPVSDVDFEPFSPLEENCSRCHSERRFMGLHGTSDNIHGIIEHMEMNPDLTLSTEDVDKVHAAMNLLKCTKCHDEEVIKKFGVLNAAMQRQVLRRMEEKPGSVIVKADEKAIQRSVQTIQGF